MIRGQFRGCLPSHMIRRVTSEPSQWEKLVWRLHMTESEAIEAIRSGKCKMLIQWARKSWGTCYVPEAVGEILELQLDFVAWRRG